MAHLYRPGSQAHHFALSHDRVADQNEVMMDLLHGPNPITDDELRRLIERRPGKYARFAGFLGKRKD